MKKIVQSGLLFISTIISSHAQLYTPNGAVQVSGNNNVGIGTAAPGYKLDVLGGDIRTDNAINPKLHLRNSTYYIDPLGLTKTGLIEFENNYLDKVSSIFAAVPPGYHTLGIGITTKSAWNGTETNNLFCHPNGNVGIGTTSPSYKLDVLGGDIRTDNVMNPKLHLRNSTYYINPSSLTKTGLIEFENNYPDKVSSIFAAVPPGYHTLGIGITTKSAWNGAETDNLFCHPNGNVGIGTTNPTSKLTVAGDINSREVKVTVNAGADFVFEKDYNLPSLTSLDAYVKENKHLPEIASAKEMQTNGINLSEMNIKLLQKVEELTLYMIEQEKKNAKQSYEIEMTKKENKIQSKEIERLKKENESFKTLSERFSKIESQLQTTK